MLINENANIDEKTAIQLRAGNAFECRRRRRRRRRRRSPSNGNLFEQENLMNSKRLKPDRFFTEKGFLSFFNLPGRGGEPWI